MVVTLVSSAQLYLMTTEMDQALMAMKTRKCRRRANCPDITMSEKIPASYSILVILTIWHYLNVSIVLVFLSNLTNYIMLHNF